MFQVPTQPRSNAPAQIRRGAPRATTAAVKFFAALLSLFSVIGFGSVAQAADNPVTQSDLCTAWNQAGTANPSFTLSSGLSVTADAVTPSGASCTTPGATVALTGAAVAKDAPSSGTNAAAQVMAAITQVAAGAQPDLKEGDEVFKGASLKNFNAVLAIGYFQISGAIEINFSATTTRLLFKGNFYGLDKYTLNLYSPVGGTSLPGVGGDPVDFKGTLVQRGTSVTLGATGSVKSLILGSGDQQVSVSDASLALSLSSGDAPHLQLAVTGKLGLGSNVSAQGSLNVDFDETGLKSFTGSGALNVTIPAKGSSPAGSVAGSAEFSYTREPLARSVTFTGDVRFGEALVAGATGTLDDQSVSFAGNVSITTPTAAVSGNVDGIAYFGDNLAGRTITNRAGQQVQATKGDGLLKVASGSLTTKSLTVAGGVQVGNVGGETWITGGGSVDLSFTQPGQPQTTIKGSADISVVNGAVQTVSFSGSVKSGDTEVASASGSLDGKKLSFSGQVTSPTLSGKATGVVYYGTDLTGETITNKAGAQVPATRGDMQISVTDGRVQLKQLNATASFTLSKVGTQTWVKTTALIQVSKTWLSFTGNIDSGGDFNLAGAGSVSFDGYVIAFKGSAVSQNGKMVLSGGGSLTTGMFTVQLSGTIEKPDMATSGYILTGTVNFKFGKYDVAGGTVRLTFGEGLTTSFELKACFLFLCQRGQYKLYFAPTGSVNRAELNAPLTSVPSFLGIGSLVLGKSVPISTKITGIF